MFGPNYLINGTIRYFFWPRGTMKRLLRCYEWRKFVTPCHISFNYFHFFVINLQELCSLGRLPNILPLLPLLLNIPSIFYYTKVFHFYVDRLIESLFLPEDYKTFSSSIFIVAFFYIWLFSPSGIYFSARLWVGFQSYYFQKTRWLS